MKHLIRRLSRVSVSSSPKYSLLHHQQQSTLSHRAVVKLRLRLTRITGIVHVPRGYVPVYVGNEMVRFFINAEVLNHPIIVELLNMSAQKNLQRRKKPVAAAEKPAAKKAPAAKTKAVEKPKTAAAVAKPKAKAATKAKAAAAKPKAAAKLSKVAKTATVTSPSKKKVKKAPAAKVTKKTKSIKSPVKTKKAPAKK